MKRPTFSGYGPVRLANLVATLGALAVFAPLSQAATTSAVLVPTDVGYYVDDGFGVSGNNHITGICDSGDACSGAGEEHRGFFVFDLSGVSDPVVAATLRLAVPSPLGYISKDPSEDYTLHEVTTDPVALAAGTEGIPGFTDLGDGPAYGSRTMSAADLGTDVEISLNQAAIDAINAAAGGNFAMGAAIATLVPAPPFSESVFGDSSLSTKELVLHFNATDDYKCYKAKDLKNPKFVPITSPPIELDDPFLTDPQVQVKKPFLVCSPTSVASGGTIDELTHLCCYKIKALKLDPKQQVTTSDAFGSLDVEIFKPQVLCRPCMLDSGP